MLKLVKITNPSHMSKPFQITKCQKVLTGVNIQTGENDQSISQVQSVPNHQTTKLSKLSAHFAYLAFLQYIFLKENLNLSY